MRQRAEDSLKARPPGPRPGWREQEQLRQSVATLQQEVATLTGEVTRLRKELQESVHLTEERKHKLELVLFDNNVTLRGTQEVMSVAYGAQHRPSLDGLQARMKQHGRYALLLLNAAFAQVAGRLLCVMGDDVFFHRQDVKAVGEPRSVAILRVARWDGRSSDEWWLWLSEYDNLKLLVSDLGRDLTGAAKKRGLLQQADFFHEKRWFKRHLLAPLSKHEGGLRDAYWQTLDGATRPRGPGRRLSTAKVQAAQRQADVAEADFFVAASAVDKLWQLFDAVNPDSGRLWTQQQAASHLSEVIGQLQTIDHWSARRAVKHLRSHGHRYTAYLVRFEHICVELRQASHWSARSVLNGLLRLWQLRRDLRDEDVWGALDYQTYKAKWRLYKDLHTRLRRECVHLDEVEHALRQELKYPKRSSSGIESFNNLLRVLHMIHRQVSDEMLALKTLAFNCKERRHPGKRQGRSPYQMLGVDIGQNERPWYELLLDFELRQRAA